MASAPPDQDKPPTYTEATGVYGGAAGSYGGTTGAVGGYPDPAGAAPPGGTQYKDLPAGQYQQPAGGYQSGAAPGMYVTPQAYQTYSPGTTIVVQPQPSVVVVGGCPACRVGVLEDDFTCLGVCCAILFFPLGILCCLAMRQRRCPNCGAVFG